MTQLGVSVSDLASEINHQLNQLMPSGMYFAATIIKLNAEGDHLTIWTGGLPESYWLGSKGEIKGLFHSQHMALGIQSIENFDSTSQEVDVELGDKIYLYSDGLTESLNQDGEMFGYERFEMNLLKYQHDRFEHFLHEFKHFTRASRQQDDITLVEMTCCQIPAESSTESIQLGL